MRLKPTGVGHFIGFLQEKPMEGAKILQALKECHGKANPGSRGKLFDVQFVAKLTILFQFFHHLTFCLQKIVHLNSLNCFMYSALESAFNSHLAMRGCAVDIGAIVEANDYEAIKGFFAINPAEIIVEGSPERVSALTIHPFSFLTLLLSSQFVPVPALRSPLDTRRKSSIERKLVFEPGPQNEGSAVAFSSSSSSSSSSSTSFSVPRFVAMSSSGGGGILCLDVASMPLDATEPRLELELRAADNIVAVATSNTSSPPPPPSSPPASASASASVLLEQRNAALELELEQLRALVAATSPVRTARKKSKKAAEAAESVETPTKKSRK